LDTLLKKGKIKMKFEATFESLQTYQCPDWFRDAKFGIWSHWGPQSVPMFGDWYARNMYIEGSSQYLYHLRHYGHPSQFGYKDICQLWKAEKFDPVSLMDLYVKAGARYFVGQAMHHDHFFNYPSKLNRFNSTEIGPYKDICGLWKQAAEQYHLPFGLTEHLGASFSWWGVNKGHDTYGPYAGVAYDGNDPEYVDFYYNNYEHATNAQPWYTSNPKFQQYWLDVMKELIDLYQPDLLYSDGALPFGQKEVSTGSTDFHNGLEAVAYLYNTSIQKYGENRAVYNQKDRRPEIYTIGILDIEKSQLNDIQAAPWQTDTCTGNWFYDVRQEFKRPAHVIEMLIDIIAKNGCMLLNVLQRPDGSLDEETVYILKELSTWISFAGEGIYGTRPWRVFGEGDSRVIIHEFEESAVQWNQSDYRFTQKKNLVYAFMMRTPDNGVSVIRSFQPSEKIVSVRLLGHGPVPYAQNFGVLTVQLPSVLPTQYTNCLAIELE
jgi:alpha-L-fucosidase